MRRCFQLCFILALSACQREKLSPLVLWDMAPGMSFQRLDSIAVHDQQERYTCLPTFGSYRECWLTTKGARGRMRAVIDSTDHVALISWHPDLQTMDLFFASQGAGLIMETAGLRRRWSIIAPMTTDSSTGYGTRSEEWLTKDRKWRGRIVWGNSEYPAELTTIDENRARTYNKLAYMAMIDSLQRETHKSLDDVRIGAEHPALSDIQAELLRLAQAQDYHRARTHHYADDIAQLHFIPREHVDIEINAASELGWWATGKHDALPGRSCVIWSGAVPSKPGQPDVRLGGTPRQPECAGTAL